MSRVTQVKDAPKYLENSTCSKRPPALHFADGVDKLVLSPPRAYETNELHIKLNPLFTATAFMSVMRLSNLVAGER